MNIDLVIDAFYDKDSDLFLNSGEVVRILVNPAAVPDLETYVDSKDGGSLRNACKYFYDPATVDVSAPAATGGGPLLRYKGQPDLTAGYDLWWFYSSNKVELYLGDLITELLGSDPGGGNERILHLRANFHEDNDAVYSGVTALEPFSGGLMTSLFNANMLGSTQAVGIDLFGRWGQLQALAVEIAETGFTGSATPASSPPFHVEWMTIFDYGIADAAPTTWL
jgi:hypothetical protein